MKEYELCLTREELEAIASGLAFVNMTEGPKPNPPTPGMTADAKVAKALEASGFGG